MSLENSPNVTPEMVRRRVEAGTVDNNEISCQRRTSTPEIVRIRTTASAAEAASRSADVKASTRDDAAAAMSAAAAGVHGISESTKASLGGMQSTTSSGGSDVVRHGTHLLGSGSRNSEILVRKGCDQDTTEGSSRHHRPASGAAEVVRYKVEQPHQLTSAPSSGSLENNSKKSIAAKKNNPILTSQYSLEKDKKQQMPLRHQVS